MTPFEYFKDRFYTLEEAIEAYRKYLVTYYFGLLIAGRSARVNVNLNTFDLYIDDANKMADLMITEVYNKK